MSSENLPVSSRDEVFWNSLEVLGERHWISREFRGRGDFRFSGSLRLSGEWTGRIDGEGEEPQLHVLPSAVVRGTLRVARVLVEGCLSDVDLEADWVLIRKGARVAGRVVAKVLRIEEGAWVEGRIVSGRRD